MEGWVSFNCMAKLSWNVCKVFSPEQVNADHVLKGAGNEEILLGEAQRLSDLRFVIRVEDLADRLGNHFFINRLVIVADIECLEIKGFNRLGFPEPQHVDDVFVKGRDRRVIGHAFDDPMGNPFHPKAAFFIMKGFGVPAQIHVIGDFRPMDFPGISQTQPFVGFFDLPSVPYFLVEDAEFIADAIADRRHAKRRKGIHVAGGQPSQGRRCPGPALLPAREDHPDSIRAEPSLPGFHRYMPRLISALPRCGPMRNSADR